MDKVEAHDVESTTEGRIAQQEPKEADAEPEPEPKPKPKPKPEPDMTNGASTTKDKQHETGASASAELDAPPSPRRGLWAEKIPALPPPQAKAENSFADGSRMDDSHVDSITEEQHIRAHLQDDVESSFLPPISPIPVAGPTGGVDDTCLFDSRTERQAEGPATPTIEAGAKQAPPPSHEEDDSEPTTRLRRSPLPRNNSAPLPMPRPPVLHRTAPSETSNATGLNDSNELTIGSDLSRSMSALENMSTSSSPAAAAAARSRSKAALQAGNRTNAPVISRGLDPPLGVAAGPKGIKQDGSESSKSPDASHSSAAKDSLQLHVPSAAKSPAPLASPSLHGGRLSPDANKLLPGMRPKFLRSRNGSQRSSVSSFTNDESHSDAAGLGVDYALQSGGATSAFGMGRSRNNLLSRSVSYASMGSMASGVDDYHSDSNRVLGPLVEDELTVAPTGNGEDSLLATPKATRGKPPLAPTDTVIANHVRNVEVPESMAKEYRIKGGLSTPVQHYRNTSSFTLGAGAGAGTGAGTGTAAAAAAATTTTTATTTRGGKNLTLKEQSSTIERLSKENFDLKLKVMFLSDRLDKLSEEGIKEMISENVELKTSLAVVQRDNKILRRRVKELEKRLRERDAEHDRPSTARSGYSSDGGQTGAEQDAHDREEELLFLREQVEDYVTEIEKLRSENMANQQEKRKLAETVKCMGDRVGDRTGESTGRQEEADVWKDLHEQETARREQADDDNRKLREEIFRLKQEANAAAAAAAASGAPRLTALPVQGGPAGALHHTTNIYNITRKGRPQSPTRSRPVSGTTSFDLDTYPMSQATTLVEELRKESEQLRHENAELRREVGAQTSMLTSRNREKDRLYQEIEDLKLASRHGGRQAHSAADSLLDRSASRSGLRARSTSRASVRTRLGTSAEEPAREELENKLAEARDKINELKLHSQELQRELETCMEDFETAVNAKRQAEERAVRLQDDLENTTSDVMALQAERDEALQDHSQLEDEFASLQREAQDEIDALEAEADQRNDDIQRLQADLQERTENFEGLQEEMRKMSDSLVRLEDEQDGKQRHIQQLEQDVSEANKELEELENKLLESVDKANRQAVQLESSQGEVAFLREEQEGDKIRIGDLEAAVATLDQSVRDERDRVKELETRLAHERKQREVSATREKEEVQEFVNDLNHEITTAKDEARRLRKSLTSREVEATEWKERLMELENNLREALGDLNGTRSSLLKGIVKLQRELENTVRELDSVKSSLLEKDRLIKQRDALLESHGLESKRMQEMLEKERQAHRNTKNSFETFQRTQKHVSRTVSSQDGRIMELETMRAMDKKKFGQLEQTSKEQLTERNKLLLLLWTRLSSLCGSDWAHNNSLINGRALPSLESVSTMLPGFSKNLLAAIKMIESLIGAFQTRIRAVEKELWKEYQALEHSLDARTQRLNQLEVMVQNGMAGGSFDTVAKISQLEAAYRALKMENATLMRANDAKTRAVGGYFDHPTNGRRQEPDSAQEQDGSPSPAIPTGPIGRKSGIPRTKTTYMEATTKTKTGTMTRSASGMTSAEIERLGTSNSSSQGLGIVENNPAPPGSSRSDNNDNRWMFRLRELEHKLKQEREARNMDRATARQRIQEGERQKDELVAELSRVKRRAAD